MKILVIGNGAREHAIIWKLLKDDESLKIYCAPGNAGIGQIAENIDISIGDIEGLKAFAKGHQIDLTLVGPEQPLVEGIVDVFEEEGLSIFGPNQRAATLEGSKAFAKDFMAKYQVPTADYQVFEEKEAALAFGKKVKYPVVVKADGLAQGKGVVIVENQGEYEATIRMILDEHKFQAAGQKIVVESFLKGVEMSLMCLVDQHTIVPLESAKDYKKIGEGDSGLNTGGMGSYSPHHLMSPRLMEIIQQQVLSPIQRGLQDEGILFQGILFIGLMIEKGQPYVLEFNTRFGDPETQSVLPRLQTPLLSVIDSIQQNQLKNLKLDWAAETCVSVVLASQGYPEAYESQKIIKIDDLSGLVGLFHGGTAVLEEHLVTNGGRVMTLTGLGENAEVARAKVYAGLDRIQFEGKTYRRDIADF